jgi:hypothetical protein
MGMFYCNPMLPITQAETAKKEPVRKKRTGYTFLKFGVGLSWGLAGLKKL